MDGWVDRPTESGILLPQEGDKIDISKERKSDRPYCLSNLKKPLVIDSDRETRSGPPKMGMRERTATGLTAPAVHGPSKSGKDNVAKSWTPTQSTFLKATTLHWRSSAEPEDPMENLKPQIKTLPLSGASPLERLCLPVAGLIHHPRSIEPVVRACTR